LGCQKGKEAPYFSSSGCHKQIAAYEYKTSALLHHHPQKKKKKEKTTNWTDMLEILLYRNRVRRPTANH